MHAIGLMSGTSLDGMDAALLETDGMRVLDFGPALTLPFDATTKFLLQRAVEDALEWRFDGDAPNSFTPAASALALCAQDAVQAVLNAAALDAEAVDVVGFHGQTVLHQPPTTRKRGKTCQIGDACALSSAIDIPVIYDFRSMDMASGGQGAPLAPAYHQALAVDLPKPVMILNIGGVGNLTWIGEDGAMLAFDTGPGNGPIDALISKAGAGEMDRGGIIAAKGQVNEASIETFLAADFFSAPPPKSLDRWDFDAHMVADMSLEDGAATLTAFCAATVARAIDWLPAPPKQILVCGGGRKNPTLMAALQARTKVPVYPVEENRWRGDALEAEAFAFLAVRHMLDMPISWPDTTGVAAPMRGGRLAQSTTAIF